MWPKTTLNLKDITQLGDKIYNFFIIFYFLIDFSLIFVIFKLPKDIFKFCVMKYFLNEFFLFILHHYTKSC